MEISEELHNLSEEKIRAYWWRYGDIGQKLVENSQYIKALLKKNYKIIDGHEPLTNRFSNLPRLAHLDIVIYNSKKKLVEGICEVKTTKNQSKREFPSNGVCAPVMKEAERNGIPLFFAIVRLNELLPTKILTTNGYVEVLENLLNNPLLYKIEFYKDNEFLLENGVFKVV
jgi:hypothetical protein